MFSIVIKTLIQLCVIFPISPARVLRGRRDYMKRVDLCMRPYLEQAGFWHAAQIKFFEYDNALLSVFVERWRPETHTFHLPYGECTITLQDIAFQLGLRVDGVPVSGCTGAWDRFCGQNIWEMCYELLGAVPPENERKRNGSTVTLAWLKNIFAPLEENATQIQIMQATRVYMMLLIGGMLFADKSAARVHLRWLPLLRDFQECGRLSWGSAVLSTLYRGLCRAVNISVGDLAGCLVLLQSWIWYRMSSLSPTIYQLSFRFPLARRWIGYTVPPDAHERRVPYLRAQIDRLNYTDFVWTPYDIPQIQQITPAWVYSESGIWASITSLICFPCVEWHHADRVLRQFGAQQPIPFEPLNIDGLHARDAHGMECTWWPDYHRTWHQLWDQRIERAVPYQRAPRLVQLPSPEYFDWYSRVARRVLSAANVFDDPRNMQLPGDAPPAAAPVHVADRPPHAPDRRRRAHRMQAGTRRRHQHAQVDIHEEDDDKDGGAGSEIGRSSGVRMGGHSQEHMASSSGHDMTHHIQEHIPGSTSHTSGGVLGVDYMPGSSSHEYFLGLSSAVSPVYQYSASLSPMLDQMDLAACEGLLNQTPLADPYSRSAQGHPNDPSGLHHPPVATMSPMTSLYDMPSFDIFGGTPPSAFAASHTSHEHGGEEQEGNDHGEGEQGVRSLVLDRFGAPDAILVAI